MRFPARPFAVNRHISRVAAATVAAAISMAAVPVKADFVVIQNQYVRAGVNSYGTLGSVGSQSPGIMTAPNGDGNFGTVDFLTPGAPFEGFYLTSSSANVYSNNDGSGTFTTSSPVLLSATSASWSGTSGAFAVTNVYTLPVANSRPELGIQTTITNISGSALTGVKFLRTLDPDPDFYGFGEYSTNNSLPSTSTVTALGVYSGRGISLSTSGTTFTSRAGVSGAWSTSPAAYLAGLNAGNGDYSIGLAFDIGTIASGASVTLDYGYYGVTAVPVVVPEPSTYAMAFGGAAMGMATFLRRRKARAASPLG